MTANPQLTLLSPEDIVNLLRADGTAAGVGKTTVEGWIASGALPSFRKGRLRLVSLEDVTKFVLLHTLKPKRPEWLTAQIEGEFRGMVRELVRQEIQTGLQDFAGLKAA